MPSVLHFEEQCLGEDMRGTSGVLDLGAAHTGVLTHWAVTYDLCGLLYVAKLQLKSSNNGAGSFFMVAN